MSTAVAELDAPTLAKPNPLADGFARLSGGQKAKLLAGILALVALVVAALVMGRQTDWKVLFANVNDKDGGAIVAQLAQMNVPYKYTEGGQAIMVPAERVHDIRLKLASQGLPKGSVSGFEMMEANRFGMTQFQERLTFQRGLEGELTRSIQSLGSVQTARIHLALPNQNGFFREQQKPSASVLVTLHPGRTLDKAQVAGIVHLVASSVPELNTKSVSVIDDAGNLLSTQPDAPMQGADTQQLQYVQMLEQNYTRRVMDILEPMLGRQNVRAQITADVDFSVSEQTSETHSPNQAGAPSTVRSQQLVENANESTNGPAGAPGAVSNIPPGQGAAPINGPGVAPSVTAPNGASGGANNSTTRRESVVNYEVDKTIRVVKGGTGNIRRLTAAVVVNHRTTNDPKTGKPISEPLPPEQLTQMTALVREAIGFSQERGDSVNLMNAAFNMDKVAAPEPLPLWQRPDNVELAKTLAWPVGALLLGLVVVFGLVRPSLKMMNPPPPPEPEPLALEPPRQLEALVGDVTERPELLPAGTSADGVQAALEAPATPEQLRLEDARRLARENPVAVANIIKGWVNGEAAS